MQHYRNLGVTLKPAPPAAFRLIVPPLTNAR